MDELFGLSMNVIMTVLLAISLVAMAAVVVMAWRNRIMVTLGLRNIPRRRGLTVLIILGVMLSTVIISAAFGTGDTLSFSIRNEAVSSLGTIDEIIVSQRLTDEDSFRSAPYFPYQRFQQLQQELAGVENADGIAPQIGEIVSTVNLRTSLSEGRMNLVGVDPAMLEGFGSFVLTSGQEVSLEELAEDEVYINDKAAKELDANPGDKLRVYLSSHTLDLRVRGVVERGGIADRDSTMLISLDRAQEMLDRAGEINLITISNRGNELKGAELSKDVARELRVLLHNPEALSQLKEILGRDVVLKALKAKWETLEGTLNPESTERRLWGQSLKKPEGAPLNLG